MERIYPLIDANATWHIRVGPQWQISVHTVQRPWDMEDAHQHGVSVVINFRGSYMAQPPMHAVFAQTAVRIPSVYRPAVRHTPPVCIMREEERNSVQSSAQVCSRQKPYGLSKRCSLRFVRESQFKVEFRQTTSTSRAGQSARYVSGNRVSPRLRGSESEVNGCECERDSPIFK